MSNTSIGGANSKVLGFYKDLKPGAYEEPWPTVTRFTLLSDVQLPFTYTALPNGLYETHSDSSGIALAEANELINIVEKDVTSARHRFNGGPEPVLNGSLKFVQPASHQDIEGSDISIIEFGGWRCLRCDHITYLPVLGSDSYIKPFECENDVCGRKGPFKPVFPVDLIKPVWLLPGIPIESTTQEVYADILNFCKDHLVLKEDEYHLLTIWIMASWLVENFQTCPYLCLIAPKSSGKSQVLAVLSELAYRAVSAISVTASSLFRAIELWHITLLVDEAEYQVKQDTEAGQALYGCLNGGYKRGSYALRTEGDTGSRIPTAYEVFGFKAIAGTKLFHPTLESRSIIINMVQGLPKNKLIDTGRGMKIRSKLLYWRMETLGKLPLYLPESKTGRIIELFSPLYTVAQALGSGSGIKRVMNFENMVSILDRQMRSMEGIRVEEETDSVEAQILLAAVELVQRARDGCENTDYIRLRDVADLLGWEDKNATQTIGYKLKAMGLKTRRTKKGKIYEFDLIENKARFDELGKRFLGGTWT